MHPDSFFFFATHASLIMVCAGVCVPILGCGLFTAEVLTHLPVRLSCKLSALEKGELIKIPFLQKAQAINGNFPTNEAHFI